MQLKRLGLGIRFDFLSSASEEEHARQAFEEIFSVLTVSELDGLLIYGGQDPLTDPAENVFLAVIMGGSLSTMRRIYEKINADAAIGMYLAHTHPFIENNRLMQWQEPSFYGEVQKDGTLRGGNGTLDGLTVPKKHGRHRPVGKGIKVLLAPDCYGPISSTEAIKRLSVAARRHFQGVKLVPVPITYGGQGMVHALVTAAEGAYRTAKITPLAPLQRNSAPYGVLYGKTAVLSLADVLPCDAEIASSFNAGELIRRALDEGLREILLGTAESMVRDCGMGCLRALGVKFYDAAGVELRGAPEDLPRVAAVDTEYLHPGLREAKITVISGGHTETPETYAEAAVQFRGCIAKAANAAMGDCIGIGGLLCVLGGAKRVSGVDALLDAVEFGKLLQGVALVVTGEMLLEETSFSNGRAVGSVLARCAARGVPAAVLAGGVNESLDEARLGNAGVAALINAPMSREEANRRVEELFDAAADRMFRLIRIGRDVEKIGAPKPPRQRDFTKMYRESLKRIKE